MDAPRLAPRGRRLYFWPPRQIRALRRAGNQRAVSIGRGVLWAACAGFRFGRRPRRFGGAPSAVVVSPVTDLVILQIQAAAAAAAVFGIMRAQVHRIIADQAAAAVAQDAVVERLRALELALVDLAARRP